MRYSGSKETFDSVLSAALPNHDVLEVLDAGCGADLCIDIGRRARVTGIDIDVNSISGNRNLAEIIVGDLQTYRFSKTYDAIICVDVLEHINDPAKALKNLCSALADGGVIIIKMPNVLSFKGLVTKFTPHMFHVLVMKHIYGVRTAGQPGQVPFPTFLRFAASPAGLRRILREEKISLVSFELFEGNQPKKLRTRAPGLYGLYRFGCWLMNALALGRIDARESEISLIGRRAREDRAPAAPPKASAL